MMASGLTGRSVIVTGGSRGIGRAIVELLASEGADVTFFYRENAQAAQAVVDAVTAAGGKAVAARLDVRDSEACAAAVERVAERCEAIDVLVNNAGAIRDNPLTGFSDADVQDVLDINVKGVFNMTRAVAPYMISKRRGRIVNVMRSLTSQPPSRSTKVRSCSQADMLIIVERSRKRRPSSSSAMVMSS